MAHRHRRRGPDLLAAWPLDPPRDPAPTGPTVAGDQAPTASAPAPVPASAPAPGATRPGLRRFFCKADKCRAAVIATDPPHRWVRVQIRDDDLAAQTGQTYVTAGVFCSLACLAAWATASTQGAG